MINIHVMSSHSYGNCDIRVSENISVKKLKDKIEQKLRSLSKNNRTIYYGSYQLNDDSTLKDYEIRDGSIIYFSIND
jgi:uncharacterized ubiquitin-like protein YukD